ncbi:unnamed protein product [Chironomus riparius]|uniref:Uncharacterized protein n=1 Tax=Chironomus riparius TaxID=315576 RepID=A0A9N9S617_9DIPT|nr:unnamed protein product [Chironomus riparius]
MAIKIFTNFFCCFPLEKFGKLFGYIYTGVIATFGILCFLAIIGYLANGNLDWDTKYVYIMIMATFLLYEFMGTIGGILFVYGVKEEIPKKLVLIIIMTTLGIPLPYLELFRVEINVTSIVILFLIMCLHIYLLLCVISAYFILRNKKSFQSKSEHV